MNLFQLATRGVDLGNLPDEEAPRQSVTFEPSTNGGKFSVPSDLNDAFEFAAKDFGIDPDVLRAVAYAESRFHPDVVSGKVKSKTGATGLMQFMPKTAQEYGIDPLDPVQSIFGAAAYLRKSLDKFDGDYGKAVASYNTNPNRKDFDAEDWDARMPAETQGYLRTVFTAADQLKSGKAERPLPAGVEPSKAGAGRGVVNPTRNAPVPDTGDETARLAARYKAPDAPQQGGFIQSVGDFFKPAPTSVLESYKPTATEQQAANAQRLRYGAGPIKGDVLVAANEVASGNANSSSPTVNAVAKQMQERGDTFTGYAQSKNTPILKEGARDAKAAEFRSAGEWAVDSVSALAQGSVSIPLLPASILAPGGDTAKTLRSWRDAWSEQESDVLKAQRVVLKERIQSEEGFAGKYATTVLELVTNPALGLSEAIKQVPNYLAVIGASRFASGAVGAGFNAIEKSSPTLALANALSSGAVKGGAQATAATAGGMAASVVMTSGDAAGDVYETLTDPNKTPKKVWEQNEDYQALIQQGLSHKAAVMQIAEAKARFAAAVVAPLGLFGFMGAESALATKGIAGLAASFGPKAAAKTFGKEIVGENIEEGGTKWGGNVVTSTVDPRVKWDEGVAEAAATATVTSAPMAGLAARSQLSAPPAQTQDPRNGLIAAGLLDPQTYDGGIVGAAGTANPLLEQLKRKPAPTVESQPTTPQVPPTVTPQAPVTPDAAKTQAVDNIAAAIKELEGGTTQTAPVPAGQQAVDDGAAPMDAAQQGATQGQAEVGAVDGAGQSESAGALTQQPVLQNRDRSNPASITQMQSIASNPDYGRLGFSRDFANGAPVVAGAEQNVPAQQRGKQDTAVAVDGTRIPVQYAVVDAGEVLTSNNVDGTSNTAYGDANTPAIRAIAGNGRVAGLTAAYRQGTAAQYKQELMADTALHGVPAEVIQGMQNPVLVRVMPQSSVTANIGDLSNTQGNLSLSAVEQAKNDVSRVNLAALEFDEAGGLTQKAVRQFVQAMPKAEQGGLIDTNGQPSKQAVDRLQAAVFAKAYGNDQLVRLFAQAQDPEARLILSAMAQLAPKIARLEGAGALDIRPIIAQAAEIAVNARREGKSIALAAKQMDMAADTAVGVVLDLFASSPRSNKSIIEAIANAADFAYAEASKSDMDMFGEVQRASRDDVINQLKPQNERASQANLEQPTGRVAAENNAVGQQADTGTTADAGATEAGGPTQEANGQVNEPGAEYSVRQQFSLFGDEQSDQLQLFIDRGPDPVQAGPGAVAAQRDAVAAIADIQSVSSILAAALTRDYAARQRISLVGQKVASAEDLAVLAQVYRDPRFETFRVVFVDANNKVVSQLGLTSRLPASAAALVGTDTYAYLNGLSATAKKAGATGYYLLHNHPSGQARASTSDVRLTNTFEQHLPGLKFQSHVVIDTNEYSTIEGGFANLIKKDFGVFEPLSGSNITFNKPEDVVAYSKRLQAESGAVTLIATDTQYRVKGVTTIPAAELNGPKGMLRLKVARALMRLQSSNVFAVGRESGALAKLSGIVVDAIHVEDSGRATSLTARGIINSTNLGAFPSDRRTRVTVDSSPEFAYLRFDPSAMKSAGQRVAEGDLLTTYTPAEVTARQDAAKVAERKAAADKRAADEQAKRERERADVAQRSVAAADTFELGGNAEDNLSGQEGLKFSRTSDIKSARVALAKIMEKGVTSPDDLRNLLRVPGYSKWAKSTIAGDVAASAELRDRLAKEYPGSDWQAPKLNDQGIITLYADWVDLTSDSIANLARIADEFDAPIAVRNGAVNNDYESKILRANGFEGYMGAQERMDRPSAVMFSHIRPAGGITATTPLFSQGAKSPRTPISTITQAIAKAYGNLLPRLEGKGLVSLTQTEEEAIAAAAQARADKTGGDVEVIKVQLRASVLASQRGTTTGMPETQAPGPQGDAQQGASTGNAVAVSRQIAQAIQDDDDPYADYGLRVIPPEADVVVQPGDELPPSNQWDDGTDTGEALDGTSSARIDGDTEGAALEAIRLIGAHGKPGPNGYYYGDQVVLIKGKKSGVGEDVGEILLNDAVVVATWRKPDKGNSEVAPNEQSTPTSQGVDIRRSADGNLEGFFDPATGKSFLIADNLTAESAPGTLMHEVGIHMAAEGKFGPMFDRALTVLNDGSLESTGALRRMQESGETSGEEAAAYLVTVYETNRTNAPASVKQWIKDFIADVRAWLFSKGVLLKADQLTIADIAAVARANASRIARGGPNGGPGGGQAFSRSAMPATIEVDGKTRSTMNSNGQPIHPTLDGVRNFWKWFGDSKVVDAEGKPLVVYHGSSRDIEIFAAGADEAGQSNGNRTGAWGSYFTPSAAEASIYAEIAGGDGPQNVVPVYLAIRNPYVMNRAEWGKHSQRTAKAATTAEGRADAKAVRAGIEALGHDGIVIRDRGFNDEWVAFSPTQIKSATGNNGDFDGTNPDIRRSVRGGGQQAQQNLALNTPSPAWMLPASTKTDALVYEIQDQKVDLKRTQEAIKAAGRTITEPFDARMAETLMPGRVAYRTETFLKTEVAPLMEAMAKNNVTQNELSDYLLARHAPERNAQIAKVNTEMPDGGAGTNSAGVLMTTQAAQDHIAALTTGKRMVLQLLANKIDAITASTRDLLVREGLEKQSTMDAWTGAYKHYVPLFKDEAVESPAHPIGSGMSVTGSASKRAMGSEGEVTNMVAHILMQREAAITRAEKNRVAMSLYGLALSNPNQEVWTTIRPNMRADKIGAELAAMGVDPVEAEQGMQGVPTIRTINAVTGLVQETPNPMYKRLENALVVKVDGEDRVILFNAKNADAMNMARALKNQDGITKIDYSTGVISQALGFLSEVAGASSKTTNKIVEKTKWLNAANATRYLASINTQYNPAFGMVNVVRDIGGALVNLTTTGIADQKAKVLGDIPAAMKGIARDVRGDQARTPWSDLWVQFQEDGGRTGYRDQFIDPFKRAEAVQKDLDALQRDSKASAGKAAHLILDLLDDFNTTLENGVRLSAYKAALDKGMSRPAAAKMARELTVDFNRKGRMGREIGPLYAFFNASVQGTARTIESLKGPAGKKIIAGGLMLGVIQSLMLAAAGFDDDEPPEFVKARAFIIPMGDKKYIAIPLQFGLNALPNTGRVITDLLLTGGKDAGKKTFNAIGEIMGSFNPMGGGNIFTAHGLLTTVAPTVADPAIDIGMNTNFSGSKIGRDRADWDTRPGFKLARESTQRSLTGQAYIGISKAINAASGGNEFKKGLASPTPEQVQYVFTTASGGLYRELEKTLNIAGLKADGFEIKPRMIPLGGRFAGEADDQDTQRSRYYRNSERLAALEAELKGFEKDDNEAAVKRIESERSDEVDLLGDYKHIRQAITKLNKLAADNINDVEMLKELDAERLELMRELNDSVRKLEKRSELFKRD